MDDESGAVTTLARMPGGCAGVVIAIEAGRGLTARLQALGVRPGRRILKFSNMLMHGPVMLEVDRTQVAVGFGAARRITVRMVGDDANTVDGKP
ncbi:ferrous iron transport protein A [Chloroflexota bacterium]